MTPLLAFALAAQTATTPPAPTAAAPANDPMICRYMTATGTIFPGRVCKPRSQWVTADRTQERDQQNQRERNTIDHTQGCTVAMAAC